VIDPEAYLPRPHKTLIYLGACLITGMRLARERQVDSRELPVRAAIDQSVDLSHEIFNRVFRKAYTRLREI